MTLTADVASSSWAKVMLELAGVLRARQIHPSKAVVLVPYAQLMQQAKLAWATSNVGEKSFFTPRFETTMNWASSLPSHGAAPDDIQMNCAIDTLTAASLLERAGLSEKLNELTGRLVEAAGSLARVAAAQAPGSRLAWGAKMAGELGVSMQGPSLVFELAIARIALAWAAASSYPTDVLFAAQPDLLVVIDGFHSDPLSVALKEHMGERAVSLQLQNLQNPQTLQEPQELQEPQTHETAALHAASDLEKEAQLAAACVLAHLAAGRSPVALVAQDRLLTRRVRAMLGGKGVLLRDETGWKLSTTRAAANLMGMLRAMPWDASTDAVLNWLKNAPAFDAASVAKAEAEIRKIGIRQWRAVPIELPEVTAKADMTAVVAQAAKCRDPLQKSRGVADWLHELRSGLQRAGQWEPLQADAAGMAVIAALHLDSALALPGNPRMSLNEFTQWVNQALEAASFMPEHPAEAHVVILPLSQLLGRPLQAVVLPGCDEIRLAVSPEPPGAWTPAQRALVCLPSRVELAARQRAAWQYALSLPHLDVLWRESQGGERLMPSGFVQELVLLRQLGPAALPQVPDPRLQRVLPLQPVVAPQAAGQALPVLRLSASAYEDLRNCPYRFFALRQLKLQDSNELQTELSKRDFGSWLHLLLYTFENSRKNAQNVPVADINNALAAMLNIAADQATQALGLSAEEFLPFAAVWPRVRDGYLDWLVEHEATGAVFVEGEVWKRVPMGRIELVGKIDRVDQLPDGSRLVLDYKTEARSTTEAKLLDADEDTQLAFYAALLEDDTVTAAYVSLGETKPTKTYAQTNIVELRDNLIGGILADIDRIAKGALLGALGEGKVCDFCAARGLCRKDFWT